VNTKYRLQYQWRKPVTKFAGQFGVPQFFLAAPNISIMGTLISNIDESGTDFKVQMKVTNRFQGPDSRFSEAVNWRED